MTDTPPPIVTRQSLKYGEGPRPGLFEQFGQAISVLLWIGVMLACGMAALSLFAASSAPQQGAAAALAVIPYCFARAWDAMRRA